MSVNFLNPLTPHKFREEYKHLHLENDQVNQLLSKPSSINKLEHILNRIRGEIHALWHYGCTRESASKILYSQVKESLREFSKKTSVYNRSTDTKTGKSTLNESYKDVSNNEKFSYGLRLLRFNQQLVKNLKKWEKISNLTPDLVNDVEINRYLSLSRLEIQRKAEICANSLRDALKNTTALDDLNELENILKVHEKFFPKQISTFLQQQLAEKKSAIVKNEIEKSSNEKSEIGSDSETINEQDTSDEKYNDLNSPLGAAKSDTDTKIKKTFDEKVPQKSPKKSSGGYTLPEYLLHTNHSPDLPRVFADGKGKKEKSENEQAVELNQIPKTNKAKSPKAPSVKIEIVDYDDVPDFIPAAPIVCDDPSSLELHAQNPSPPPLQDSKAFEKLLQYATSLNTEIKGISLAQLLTKNPNIVNTPFPDGTLPFHFAILYSDPSIVDFLFESAKLTTCDIMGFNAFDIAVQANNDVLARKIMLANMKSMWPTIEQSYHSANALINPDPFFVLLNKLTDQVNGLQSNKILGNSSVGYAGNNPLLVNAIEKGDFRLFLRSVETGAHIDTVDDKGDSLLHLAAKAGQKEIVWYLLTPKVSLPDSDSDCDDTSDSGDNGQIPSLAIKTNNDEKTPLQIAEENNQSDVAELIRTKLSSSLDSENRLVSIENSVQDYIHKYKAWYVGQPESFRNQLCSISKHGNIESIKNGAAGHNSFVLDCILSGDVKRLARCVDAGAALDTIGLPNSKAFVDPLDDSIKVPTLQETMVKSGDMLKALGQNVKIGDGKSLLDMAVIHGEGDQNNLDIISYLLRIELDPETGGKFDPEKSKPDTKPLRLDPLKTNDEADTPFSIAVLKGNLQAAALMLNFRGIENNRAFKISESQVSRTLTLLKVGSKLRDPLNVGSSKVKDSMFALAFLGSSLFLGYQGISALGYVSMLTSAIFAETFREKITSKPVAPMQINPHLYSAIPMMQMGAQLDMLMPGLPLGMPMQALSVHLSANQVLSTANDVHSHAKSRPFSTAVKIGVDVLSMFQYMKWLYSSGSQWASYGASLLEAEKCPPVVDSAEFKNKTSMERINHAKLDAKCQEHARIILNIDEDTLKNDTKHLGRVYRRAALPYHFDKASFRDENIDPKEYDLAYEKLTMAYETLSEKSNVANETLSQNKVPTGATSVKRIYDDSIIVQTALKAGMVFGSVSSAVQNNVPGVKYVFPLMTWGALAYRSYNTIRSYTG